MAGAEGPCAGGGARGGCRTQEGHGDSREGRREGGGAGALSLFWSPLTMRYQLR